mmetsp:Transcript_41039/g.117961  ORF Transcript_41039/g.117961 Transcript_41039/m.117961 type:complete len:345 (+) Transcript_41039:349-1383(+)
MASIARNMLTFLLQEQQQHVRELVGRKSACSCCSILSSSSVPGALFCSMFRRPCRWSTICLDNCSDFARTSSVFAYSSSLVSSYETMSKYTMSKIKPIIAPMMPKSTCSRTFRRTRWLDAAGVDKEAADAGEVRSCRKVATAWRNFWPSSRNASFSRLRSNSLSFLWLRPASNSTLRCQSKTRCSDFAVRSSRSSARATCMKKPRSASPMLPSTATELPERATGATSTSLPAPSMAAARAPVMVRSVWVLGGRKLGKPCASRSTTVCRGKVLGGAPGPAAPRRSPTRAPAGAAAEAATRTALSANWPGASQETRPWTSASASKSADEHRHLVGTCLACNCSAIP